MKNFVLISVFLTFGILFSSCNKNESASNEMLDNTVLKEEFKDQLVEMYNTRNINNGGIKQSNASGTFTLTSAEKQQLAGTALSLLKSYGLTEAEINADLGGITEDKLVDVALSICNIEEKASNNIELVDPVDNVSFLTGKKILANNDFAIQTQSQLFDCAMAAIGVTAVFELMDKGIERMGKAAVRKLLTKVATKYLSWVGVAIAVYEFGDCMSWW